MKLQEIIDMWKEDSKIDRSELGNELERTYQLHGKYIDILTKERLVLRGLVYEFKREKLNAFEEYTQGPARDSSRKLPAAGRVFKGNTELYIDADEDLQNLGGKIDIAKAKVEALESIVNMIIYRNNSVNGIIDWVKYTGGS